MKQLTLIFSLLLSIGIVSCIKNEPETFTSRVAEIDQTTYNANAAGLTYPILTRVPAAGRVQSSACPDSVMRRFSGTMRLRINLVGPQSEKEETVGFQTFDSPITTVSFPATIGASTSAGCPTAQTPARAAASLAVTNAVAGTHYNFTNATSGKITIPANSSFGYLDISLLNAGASTGGRFIGIKLDSTGTILPNVNYSSIGLVIDQR
jgi:hypothetical protein